MRVYLVFKRWVLNNFHGKRWMPDLVLEEHDSVGECTLYVVDVDTSGPEAGESSPGETTDHTVDGGASLHAQLKVHQRSVQRLIHLRYHKNMDSLYGIYMHVLCIV